MLRDLVTMAQSSDQSHSQRARKRWDHLALHDHHIAAHDAQSRKAAKTTSIVDLDQADQTTATSIVDHDQVDQTTTTSTADLSHKPDTTTTTTKQTENSTKDPWYEETDEHLYHPLRIRVNDIAARANEFFDNE